MFGVGGNLGSPHWMLCTATTLAPVEKKKAGTCFLQSKSCEKFHKTNKTMRTHGQFFVKI